MAITFLVLRSAGGIGAFEVKKKASFPLNRSGSVFLCFPNTSRRASPVTPAKRHLHSVSFTWHGDQYPKKALFKFRLPHATENLSKESMETGKNLALAPGSNLFSYLDGELRIQAYPRQGSAEMRLIPNGKKRLWDVRIHDNKAMTHNVLCTGYYEHEEVEGCDHCFDCAFEIYIWQNYIKKYGKTEPVRHYVNLLNSKLANGKFTPLTYRSKGD